MGFEIDVQAVVVRYARYGEPQKSRQTDRQTDHSRQPCEPYSCSRDAMLRLWPRCLYLAYDWWYLFGGIVILHLEA